MGTPEASAGSAFGTGSGVPGSAAWTGSGAPGSAGTAILPPEPERQQAAGIAPTPRLALLLLLAGLPSLVPGWFWLSGALTGILLAVALADLALSRRAIELVRKVEPVLSLDALNKITLELRTMGESVLLDLKEDLPLHMEQVDGWPQSALTSGQWSNAEYRIRPLRRGQYALGPLHGRYQSRLRLWHRHITWKRTALVRVYPNLLAARQWEIAIRRGRHLEGLKRARLRGAGTEFESLREYQPGDQYRAINWPATARSGELVTTLYQVDRSQPVLLVLDAGRLMIPRVKGLAKLDHALNAALLLATVAAERGDQLGLMLFGGEVKAFMPPRKGRGQVLSMLEALYTVVPEQVEPDYGRMISWLRAKHKKRSLVVFFTDLIDPDISQRLLTHLAALCAHHLVLVVCLSDPELLRVCQQMPDSSSQVYEKAVALEVLAERTEAKRRLHSLGIMVIDVPPEAFSAAVVNQYLMVKEQGRL